MNRLELQGKLALDGSGWEKTLRQAGTGIENFANNSLHHLKSAIAGAFAIGALEEFARKTIEYAAQIKDFAEQTGISTDEVQRLAYAAKSVGLEFGDFQTALSKMGAARKDAAEKNDELLATFKRFGVSLADLQNPSLRNIDLLHKMAEAIRGVNLTAGDRQSLREFFGKAGDKLAEVIGHLDDFKSRPIISKEDVEAIDRLDKAVERLMTRGKVGIAGPIADLSRVVSPENDEDQRKGLKGLAGTYARLLFPEIIIFEKGVKTFHDLNNPTSPASASSPIARGTGEMFGPNQLSASSEDLFVDQRKVKLQTQLEELGKLQSKNAFDLLDADQKRAQLQQEINQLLIDAKALRPSSEELSNDLLIERQKKIAQLNGLNRPVNVDSFQGLGGVLGHTTREIPAIQERLIEAHARTTTALHRVATALENHNPGENSGGFALP